MSIFGETTATCFCTWPKRSPSVTVHSLRKIGSDRVRKSRMADSPLITQRPLEKFSTSKPARESREAAFSSFAKSRTSQWSPTNRGRPSTFPSPGGTGGAEP